MISHVLAAQLFNWNQSEFKSHLSKTVGKKRIYKVEGKRRERNKKEKNMTQLMHCEWAREQEC